MGKRDVYLTPDTNGDFSMPPTVDVLTTDFNADYCTIQRLTTGDFAVFDNENSQYVATCPNYLTLVNWLKKPIPPLSALSEYEMELCHRGHGRLIQVYRDYRQRTGADFETAKRAIHEYIESCG